MYQKTQTENAIAITLLREGVSDDALNPQQQDYIKQMKFKWEAGKKILIPHFSNDVDAQSKKTDMFQYYGYIGKNQDFTDWAKLTENFPPSTYYLANPEILDDAMLHDFVLTWGLNYYRYNKFISDVKPTASLVLPEGAFAGSASKQAEIINWGRDLINHPANYLTPEQLTIEAEELSAQYKAKFSSYEGDVLEQGYPLIHAVGKAAKDAPRLIELKWSGSGATDNKNCKNITLIGKGVTFDSGGLDLKPSKGMLIMKKDMGGAAHSLVLARMIMEYDLPVNLRLLIPAVENAVSRDSFRPMDILSSRQGLTIEVGNTDAEGRLVLADALTVASEESPDIIIDFATLTGAARVATGTELPNLFSNRKEMARTLCDSSFALQDPLWAMPLFKQYKRFLKSDNADLNNAPSYPYAGSITAALFLQEFVDNKIPWVHLDVMAWNLSSLPAKPRGGEIQGVRTIYQFLRKLIFEGVITNEYETHSTSNG